MQQTAELIEEILGKAEKCANNQDLVNRKPECMKFLKNVLGTTDVDKNMGTFELYTIITSQYMKFFDVNLWNSFGQVCN